MGSSGLQKNFQPRVTKKNPGVGFSGTQPITTIDMRVVLGTVYFHI